MLTRNDKNRHASLVPILRGKAFSLSPLSIMFFMNLRKFPSTPSILRVFIMNKCWILSNVFFFANWYGHMDGASLVAQEVKNPPAMQETWVQSLVQEEALEKGRATHSSILAWRIWQRSLVGYSSWGRKESDIYGSLCWLIFFKFLYVDFKNIEPDLHTLINLTWLWCIILLYIVGFILLMFCWTFF